VFALLRVRQAGNPLHLPFEKHWYYSRLFRAIKHPNLSFDCPEPICRNRLKIHGLHMAAQGIYSGRPHRVKGCASLCAFGSFKAIRAALTSNVEKDCPLCGTDRKKPHIVTPPYLYTMHLSADS
jgi:hypothetical protein